MTEIQRGNELADVVTVKKDQLVLNTDIVDKFFKEKETSLTKEKFQDMLEKKQNSSKNRDYETFVRRLSLIIDRKLFMGDPNLDPFIETKKSIESSSFLNVEEKASLKELYEQAEPFINQSPVVVDAKISRKDVDDLVTTINKTLSIFSNNPEMQKFIAEIDQKTETSFQTYLKSEESAGKALYESLRNIKNIDLDAQVRQIIENDVAKNQESPDSSQSPKNEPLGKQAVKLSKNAIDPIASLIKHNRETEKIVNQI